MKEVLEERRLCTGCSACAQACPQRSIEMKADAEGFSYPAINPETCTDCGICRRTCPVYASLSAGVRNSRHKAYACFSNDDQIRSKSSSGGIFTQLALDVVSRGGAVFGAGFDEDFKVRHSYAETADGLDALRRSKYVQSDIGNTFIKTREFLQAGRPVLYCGTPCQIAGLKSFLKREDENLLTCDLACHGVPSPKVWEMYLDFIREKYQSRITAVSFRDKLTGWNDSSMKIDFENGRQYTDRVKREIFFIGFGKSIFNRRSCYDCRFHIDNTRADVTLADFWGIDKQDGSEYLDNKGVSLVITHTEAGEKALSRIKDGICMKEGRLDEAVRYNPRLVSSVGESAGRKSFFGDMADGWSFDRLRRKYMDNLSMKYRLKGIIKSIIGR